MSKRRAVSHEDETDRFKGLASPMQPSARAAHREPWGQSAVIRSVPGTGVGGGIRLQEAAFDLESRQDNRVLERPISLTGQRIFRGLALCGILGALAIAHVQLRFVINDSRLQHQRMQRVHRELLQQYALLERANAQLSDYDRLHEYATQELHMVEIPDRPTASITTDVRTKYTVDSVLQSKHSSLSPRAVANGVTTLRKSAGQRFQKLVDSGRAALNGVARP
jgi:hypothetical protein